jgi:hypothetical protein
MFGSCWLLRIPDDFAEDPAPTFEGGDLQAKRKCGERFVSCMFDDSCPVNEQEYQSLAVRPKHLTCARQIDFWSTDKTCAICFADSSGSISRHLFGTAVATGWSQML